VGIFEMHNNVNAATIVQVKVLLNSFDLFNKVIMYVKNEWLNIVIFTFALTCVHLLYLVFHLNCHVMLKVEQYVIDDVKVCSNFIKVDLKGAQTSL